MLAKGGYRCYEWNYCPPEHCYIIIAVSENNNIVQSEYYILADDEKIDLIYNPLTPFNIPKDMIGNLIMKASKEAFDIARGHAEGILFVSHQHKPYCSHKDPVRINNSYALNKWYENPNLRNKLLQIENKTLCKSLKASLEAIRKSDRVRYL